MRSRGITPITTTPARKISTLMAAGRMWPTTGKCGRPMDRQGGRRIAMATGPGSLTTAGRGLGTSRGDGRHITMAAGCITAIRGPGGRDRCGAQGSIVPSGRRGTYRSLAGAGALDLVSASAGEVGADLAGCHWGQVIGSIRGGAATAAGFDLPAGAAAASGAFGGGGS